MRFLFGLIVGVAATVGSAYVHDMGRDGEDSRGRLVNWSVAEDAVRALSSGWTRLADDGKGR